MRLPFTVWFTRAFLPLLGTAVALGLLTTAAVALVFDAFSSITRWHVFMAGVNTHLASIVWGIWVNGRPLPPRVTSAEREDGAGSRQDGERGPVDPSQER